MQKIPDHNKNKDTLRGVLTVLAAGCFWGTTGVFVRILDEMGYSILTILFARVALSFVLTFMMLVVTGQTKLLRIRLKDLWCFIGTGLSSAILLNLFFSMSVLMNSLSFAAILIATMPIFVVLLSAPIFGERITPVKIQALIIAFAGCVLTSGITGGGFVFSPEGVLVGLLSAVGYALYSIMSRFALNRGYDSLTINVYSFGIGTLICIPFTDFALIAATVSHDPVRMIVILLLNSLLAALLPYMLYTLGMKYIDTGKASILVSVEPVAATVLGILLYAEIPSVLCVIGIILVLFAIALLNIPGGLSALRKRFH